MTEKNTVEAVRISEATRAQVARLPKPQLTDDRRRELETYIAENIKEWLDHREREVKRRAKWRNTLAGRRHASAPLRDGASNISVPLSIWAAAGIRARVDEGAFGTDEIVAGEAMGTLFQAFENPAEAQAQLLQFINKMITDERGWNGRNEGTSAVAETVNYGTAGFLVEQTLEDMRVEAPLVEGEAPKLVPAESQLRWRHIPYPDLILFTGYGDDTQAMPFVGYQYKKPWGEILRWSGLGHYDETSVDEVKAFFMNRTDVRGKRNDEQAKPALLREHNVAELYVTFPISETLTAAPLLVDYHMDAQKILRVRWNTMPRGIRPLWITQFDKNPDPKMPEGQGVCEKIEGAQDETDVLHNLGIEAGKRAAVYVICVKEGSGALRSLGNRRSAFPGDVIVTDNLKEDFDTKPLGDVKAVEAAAVLEDRSRQYVMRILGLDESSLGQVDTGKRVPASLGISIQREGRIVVTHSLGSFGKVLEQMTYLSLELTQRRVPIETLRAVIGNNEAAQTLASTVFVPGVNIRNGLRLTVRARDAAAMKDEQQQEIAMMIQFLFMMFDKLMQYGEVAIQLKTKMPQLAPIVEEVIEKVQNSAKILMATMDSVPNTALVVPKVAEMLRGLDELGASLNQTQAAPPQTDLGGGVV